MTTNLYNNTGQADWGYNVISNGGNIENSGWRTLTKDEWEYLFNNSARGSYRYLKARITVGSNNYNGVILFPDNYDGSIGSFITSYNQNDTGWASVSEEYWTAMESVGAVFLPAAGIRPGTNVSSVGSTGAYWSSTYYSNFNAYYVSFYSTDFNSQNYRSRSNGTSVHLVRAVE